MYLFLGQIIGNRKLVSMGMSTVSTASEAMKLCMFDLRRGQHEGQELDKILFFFPADLPFSTQLSVIGLSEGLITFTRFVLTGICILVYMYVYINEIFRWSSTLPCIGMNIGVFVI